MSSRLSTRGDSEGDAKRQKVVDNVSLQSLFDTARRLKNINLIEDEFDKTEDKNEISFKTIKEKLQSSEYSNKQGFVTDLSKVAARAKKSFISWQIFDAASELESFVDTQAKTFAAEVNLPHRQYIQSKEFASVLLQLNLDEEARSIRLDANRSLENGQDDSFLFMRSRLQQANLLLSWPLPVFEGPKDMKALADLSKKFQTHTNTFSIGDSEFEVRYSSLAPLLPYSINITENNEMKDDDFIKKYVHPYLKNSHLKDVKLSGFDPGHQKFRSGSTETAVETQLNMSIYNVLSPFILKGFEEKKERISGQMKNIIKERSYIATAKYSDFQFDSFFTDEKREIPFLGTKTKPDLQIGYLADNTVVFLSGIGGAKYISLDLMSNLEELKRLGKLKIETELPENNLYSNSPSPEPELQTVDSTVASDDEELTFSDSSTRNASEGGSDTETETETEEDPLKVLQETITEYVSICAILGTTRFVISDYNSFLFINLKVEEDADSEGVKGINPADEELKKQRHIKVAYSCFSLLDPGIRLMFLSFFWLDDSFLKELADFRDNVSQLAEEIIAEVEEDQRKHMEKDAKGRSATVLLDTNTNATETWSRLIKGNSNESDDLELNPEIFRFPALVTLGDKVIKEMVSLSNVSQVVSVEVESFKEQVFSANFINKDYPETLILKVYDPIGCDLKRYNEKVETYVSNYTYQDSIDFTVKEVECYLQLKQHQGDFLPHLFAYGRLADTYSKVGEPYLRLAGGFTLIEKLENEDNFKVDRKYFETKILKAFHKMHRKDVVHNDIKRDNFVFQKDAFKIIDFGHSIYPATQEDKKAEMDLLYRYFGYHR